MKIFFGHGSAEYTTLQLHKTDACAECEQLRGDIQWIQKSIGRHLLQRGDMSFERDVKVNQLKEDKKDCEESLTGHMINASNAADEYKRAISGSSSRFLENPVNFHRTIQEAGGESLEKRLFIARSFAKAASGDIFNINSDCQMGKHVPQ